ncbi:hypothetical protein ACFQFH_20110 [Halobaculum halobium]|uniref:Uncharacterized protein n=1 Tax=Halobaculum halobium TaxID=3032281 RepID=A0ABD5T749_9EURY|nr:hypothetical protein [Halobaculum sp. SYNS20]
MANIENTEYEDMTDEELKRVREKMDDDTGRTGGESDGTDNNGGAYADPPEEVR